MELFYLFLFRSCTGFFKVLNFGIMSFKYALLIDLEPGLPYLPLVQLYNV